MVGPTLRSVHGGWGAGGSWLLLLVASQTSQQDRKLTYKAIITPEKPCSSHLHLKAEIKSGLLYFVCLVFLGLFFLIFLFQVFVGVFVFCFCFLVQHNLKRLKAFQPKCGGKTGKALFLHKTSIPNSANESGTS